MAIQKPSFHTEAAYRTIGGTSWRKCSQHLPTPFRVDSIVDSWTGVGSYNARIPRSRPETLASGPNALCSYHGYYVTSVSV